MLGNLALTSQPWHYWRFGTDNSFLLGVRSWALQNVNSGPGSFSLEAGGSVSPLPQGQQPKLSRYVAKCWGGDGKLPSVLVNRKHLDGRQKGRKVAILRCEDQCNLFT